VGRFHNLQPYHYPYYFLPRPPAPTLPFPPFCTHGYLGGEERNEKEECPPAYPTHHYRCWVGRHLPPAAVPGISHGTLQYSTHATGFLAACHTTTPFHPITCHATIQQCVLVPICTAYLHTFMPPTRLPLHWTGVHYVVPGLWVLAVPTTPPNTSSACRTQRRALHLPNNCHLAWRRPAPPRPFILRLATLTHLHNLPPGSGIKTAGKNWLQAPPLITSCMSFLL